MVAGKVKKVMGLQKSPATPKLETAPSQRSSSLPNSPLSAGKVTVFSRSVGVYFPRSSAQVQLRSPSIADLFRLIEDLQETESRLRTELLEQKILKETVSIVPFLEKEVAAKDEDLDRTRKIVEGLEAETRALRIEVETLRVRIQEIEEEARRRGKEVEELRRTVTEQQSELKRFCENGCSSSEQFQGLIDASAKSILLKNVRKSTNPIVVVSNHEASKLEFKDRMREEGESERLYQHNNCEMEEILKPRKAPRVPNPPPLPSASLANSLSPTMASGNRNVGSMLARFQAIKPPLPPPPPPPPPPPSAAKGRRMGAAAVRRAPEVVEFYHSLMRRDSRRDSSGGVSDAMAVANTRKMIGEIENRSAHLHAIKREVETQGDFIRFLIKAVESAAFSDIEDLVAFVKWLDHELSFLVDERAVLKHFDWPEAKSDAMREAAFEYCDLRKLESEASSFCDDPRQPRASALKKMQSLLEKLELAVYNLSRVREIAMERYKNFQIPWEWMLDCGIVSQIKLASVKLAMKYMKRVSFEIEAILGPEEEDLMLRGVRFAFRVHQFAGGFDVETMCAFQELKEKARKVEAHEQKNQQQ
ncbi:protein CHUP1, chloroplastic [Dendrobium catenatum]|uniref:Protein CHUP1, chloroplastic n=1 Tax=Dendrobium catenatum TaxID=906689 RepID=A0A2I0VQU0_9ASPA|nr:protein CHUP1, chloroplastic [Dendrobium catenatum]PKU65779.1 Protein CHUP1, chloroplastic [Dendrobium catenatum]